MYLNISICDEMFDGKKQFIFFDPASKDGRGKKGLMTSNGK